MSAMLVTVALAAASASAQPRTPDEDILRRYLTDLPPIVDGLDALDDREALSPPEALVAAFDALLRTVPAEDARKARVRRGDPLNAVGRIEGVKIQRQPSGQPVIASLRGGGAVIHDWQCSFLFATVAHTVFDLDSGERRYAPKTMRIFVAGNQHEPEQIESMFPDAMTALDSLRALADFMLLVVQKPRPCEPYPVLAPVTAMSEIHLAGRGQIGVFCHDPKRSYPALTSRSCAALVQARPFPPKQYGVRALAYASCAAPFGTSGCPLILELEESYFFLGVQARAAISVSKGKEAVNDIYLSTRVPLLSGEAWMVARAMMQEPYDSR